VTGGVLTPLSEMRPWPGESSDAFTVRLQAEATKRAGGGKPVYVAPSTPDEAAAALSTLGSTLPPLRPPPRIRREKVHAADIPEVLPPLDSAAYHKRLGEVALARAKGDPLAANIEAVGRAIYYAMSARIRLTIRQIAKRAKCCPETARRCIDYLSRSGIVGVLNVLVRVDKLLLRSANLYLAPAFIVTTGIRLARRVAERSAAFLAECGKLLGLEWRPDRGFNTTPLRQPGGT
jgi:hypothetical protein